MGSGVRVWRLPEEESDFARLLEAGEPVVVLPHLTYPSEDQIRWLPPAQAFATSNERVFLIVPTRFLPLVRTGWEERHTGSGFGVNAQVSPLLFYERGKILPSGALSSTSIGADFQYLSPEKKFLDYPTDFVRWARKVVVAVRKSAPHRYRYRTYYVTEKAEQARLNGLEFKL